MQRVEDYLESLLLQDVVIKTNEKVLKKGKLIIYNTKQFYLRLTLEQPGTKANRLYEIPYPFQIHTCDESDILTLNYKLSNVCNYSSDEFSIINAERNKISTPSRMYDKFVYILPSALA
jgi:hypothetical protein